jgi:hypothetical protein
VGKTNGCSILREKYALAITRRNPSSEFLGDLRNENVPGLPTGEARLSGELAFAFQKKWKKLEGGSTKPLSSLGIVNHGQPHGDGHAHGAGQPQAGLAAETGTLVAGSNTAGGGEQHGAGGR